MGENGHLQDAVEVFKKAISIEKNHIAAYSALGWVYTELENFKEAVDAYKEAIRIKPDFAEAHYNLGDAYFHVEQYQEAIESYSQAIQINPNYAEALFSMGVIYRIFGQYDLEHEDPDLRFDALACLRPVTEVREYLEVYRKCLKDRDHRIRRLALRRLAEEGGSSVSELKEEIEALINDLNMEVKRATLEILKRHK